MRSQPSHSILVRTQRCQTPSIKPTNGKINLRGFNSMAIKQTHTHKIKLGGLGVKKHITTSPNPDVLKRI